MLILNSQIQISKKKLSFDVYVKPNPDLSPETNWTELNQIHKYTNTHGCHLSFGYISSFFLFFLFLWWSLNDHHHYYPTHPSHSLIIISFHFTKWPYTTTNWINEREAKANESKLVRDSWPYMFTNDRIFFLYFFSLNGKISERENKKREFM